MLPLEGCGAQWHERIKPVLACKARNQGLPPSIQIRSWLFAFVMASQEVQLRHFLAHYAMLLGAPALHDRAHIHMHLGSATAAQITGALP